MNKKCRNTTTNKSQKWLLIGWLHINLLLFNQQCALARLFSCVWIKFVSKYAWSAQVSRYTTLLIYDLQIRCDSGPSLDISALLRHNHCSIKFNSILRVSSEFLDNKSSKLCNWQLVVSLKRLKGFAERTSLKQIQFEKMNFIVLPNHPVSMVYQHVGCRWLQWLLTKCIGWHMQQRLSYYS